MVDPGHDAGHRELLLGQQGHDEVVLVVARIYDPRRAAIYQRLGIPTVATVAWTTDQVRRRLLPDRVVSEWTDPGGAVSLIERRLPDGWAGRKLAELDEGDRFRLVALSRGGQSRLASPSLVGQEGDILYLAVRTDAVEEIRERLVGGAGGHR